jgi:hypothetical protein
VSFIPILPDKFGAAELMFSLVEFKFSDNQMFSFCWWVDGSGYKVKLVMAFG